MRLRWSFFLLSLLGQGAIADPVPMYEESIQRPDPLKAYTSSRAKHQGREREEEVRRRGNDGTTGRAGAPYFSEGETGRRKIVDEEAFPEGPQRSTRSDFDFGRVHTDRKSRLVREDYRRSLDDVEEEERSLADDVAAFEARMLKDQSEGNDRLRFPSLQSQSQSQSQSLEKRIDYWQPRPSQRTRRTRQGLILLALSGVGGLTTWGVLRTRKREAERKRKKQEEEAAAAEAAKAKGHSPAPSPTGAPAPAPASKP